MRPAGVGRRTLAVVTARGGSKRLPGKNIRMLGGKPLIAWSVEPAIRIGRLCDVLISTDDPEIAEAARAAGGLVPWLRPASLSGDAARSAEACIHALDWYERGHGLVDALMLLQPTSPFRTRETIGRGIDLFYAGGRRPVVAVAKAPAHPDRCYRIERGSLRPFTGAGRRETRTQDLEPAYAVNGALYVIAPGDLRKRRSFYRGDMRPLVLEDPAEALDIDTEWDWRIAEALVEQGAARRVHA